MLFLFFAFFLSILVVHKIIAWCTIGALVWMKCGVLNKGCKAQGLEKAFCCYFSPCSSKELSNAYKICSVVFRYNSDLTGDLRLPNSPGLWLRLLTSTSSSLHLLSLHSSVDSTEWAWWQKMGLEGDALFSMPFTAPHLSLCPLVCFSLLSKAVLWGC